MKNSPPVKNALGRLGFFSYLSGGLINEKSFGGLIDEKIFQFLPALDCSSQPGRHLTPPRPCVPCAVFILRLDFYPLNLLGPPPTALTPPKVFSCFSSSNPATNRLIWWRLTMRSIGLRWSKVPKTLRTPWGAFHGLLQCVSAEKY